MQLIEVLVLVMTFVLFLGIGLPIAFAIGLSSLFTLLINMDSIPAFTTFAQRMATGLDSFALLAIPFFVLAGQIMNQGGIAKRLISFAKALVGTLPGGLAYVNILACMLFGAISGSAVAAASAIGGFMGEAMEKEGYKKEFSAAINITSSTTGLLIPPSNVLIVYSLASGGVSVATLFLAGYIPGILVGLILMIIASFHIRKNKYPAGERVSLREFSSTFLAALPSLFLLILVIGGIVAGIFTATEASAIAVLYSFILSYVIYKEIKTKDIAKILLESCNTTAIVMLLIACSMGMSWVLSFEDIPQNVSAALLSISDNKIVILLIINLILLFVGIFMDMTPAVLIFTPIFLPVVTNVGIDPTHFGIIMILNLCIGLCTPPVGSILFVGCSVANIPVQKVVKPLMPFFLGMLLVLILITYIPQLSLWLPALFGY